MPLVRIRREVRAEQTAHGTGVDRFPHTRACFERGFSTSRFDAD